VESHLDLPDRAKGLLDNEVEEALHIGAVRIASLAYDGMACSRRLTSVGMSSERARDKAAPLRSLLTCFSDRDCPFHVISWQHVDLGIPLAGPAFCGHDFHWTMLCSVSRKRSSVLTPRRVAASVTSRSRSGGEESRVPEVIIMSLTLISALRRPNWLRSPGMGPSGMRSNARLSPIIRALICLSPPGWMPCVDAHPHRS
jgi:hypothetical protein